MHVYQKLGQEEEQRKWRNNYVVRYDERTERGCMLNESSGLDIPARLADELASGRDGYGWRRGGC